MITCVSPLCDNLVSSDVTNLCFGCEYVWEDSDFGLCGFEQTYRELEHSIEAAWACKFRDIS